MIQLPEVWVYWNIAAPTYRSAFLWIVFVRTLSNQSQISEMDTKDLNNIPELALQIQ